MCDYASTLHCAVHCVRSARTAMFEDTIDRVYVYSMLGRNAARHESWGHSSYFGAKSKNANPRFCSQQSVCSYFCAVQRQHRARKKRRLLELSSIPPCGLARQRTSLTGHLRSAAHLSKQARECLPKAMATCEYEILRQQRIADNRKRMEQLGLQKVCTAAVSRLKAYLVQPQLDHLLRVFYSPRTCASQQVNSHTQHILVRLFLTPRSSCADRSK